jgi:hypothetical protein
MRGPDIPDRVVLLLIGLLVLLSPVLILALTLAFLAFTGDLLLGRVTPLELLELYVIELASVVVIAYGLYRLVRLLVVHRLPGALDADDRGEGPTGQDADDP